MRIILMAAILAAGIPAVQASGGVSCEVKDKSLELEAGGGIGRGVGGSLLNFEGTMKVALKGTPADFRELKLRESDVIQRWIDGKEVRLQLYRERNDGPFGYVNLEILTKRVDEGRYAGRYALTVSHMQSDKAAEAKEFRAKGKVTCLTE